MWFLAIRHLTSKKRQTILTLFGIVLGTAAYIAISGMMLGFQSFIVDQLVNNDAHVRVSAREELITAHSLDETFFGEQALVTWIAPPSGRRDNAYILYPQAWFDRFESMPEVVAYSEQLVVQGLATRGKVSTSVRVIGVQPTKQSQVTTIETAMLNGKFSAIGTSGNRIIAGQGLLQKLGASVNDTLILSAGKAQLMPFKVVGSFRVGVKGIDDTTLYGALTDVQKMNATPSRVSDIAVRLARVEDAAILASSWNKFGQEKVQSWDQANEGIMSVFTTQDIVRNSMTVTILIVAGFGIYNILNMAVNQKRREIAILRSIGFESKDVIQLFLIQGVLLGAVGGLIGCGVGYLVCEVMARIPVSADRGLGGNTMMIVFFPGIYVRGFLLAFFSSSFAGFLPARQAGKLSPIQIIRGENS
jgi:lipoprotein-releasing system permease protein